MSNRKKLIKRITKFEQLITFKNGLMTYLPKKGGVSKKTVRNIYLLTLHYFGTKYI